MTKQTELKIAISELEGAAHLIPPGCVFFPGNPCYAANSGLTLGSGTTTVKSASVDFHRGCGNPEIACILLGNLPGITVLDIKTLKEDWARKEPRGFFRE